MPFDGPLPHFTLGPWSIGPITIHSFGVFVAVGVMLAYQLALRRARRLDVDPRLMDRALLYLLGFGFVGGHVFDVLLYRSQTLVHDPLVLLRLYESLSSYGGLLGALLGLLVFWLRHRSAPIARIADAAAFSLPLGWLFGRIGCAFAHDHPGRLTDFFLAVDFGSHWPGGVRHDLGLYEALWWIVILATFVLVDRARPRLQKRAGFYPGLLAVMYGPARFALDFLRAPPTAGGDARYLGLTPAQYLSVLAFGIGVYLLRRSQKSATPPTFRLLAHQRTATHGSDEHVVR